MSVLAEMFYGLNAMSLSQLLAAFVASIGYVLMQGGMLASRGRLIAFIAMVLGIAGFALQGADWVRAVILAGEGPVFIEFSTYRWREHCGPFYDNNIGYRSEQEFEEWKQREPIDRFEKDLLKQGVVTQAELDDMDRAVTIETEEAFDFAETSPFPAPDDAFTGLYANPIRPDAERFKG